MLTEPAKAQFTHLVHRALTGLYDPAVLNGSPLAALFDVAGRSDTAPSLRRILIDAIESLQPRLPTPVGSRSWRIYQVLRRRFTEQLTQQEVASTLGFSIRQLQREEKAAREALADYLWTKYGLDAKASLLASLAPALHTPGQTGSAGDGDVEEDVAPSPAQELDRLSDATPAQLVSLAAVLQDVLTTLRPLIEQSGADIEVVADDAAPHVLVQVPMLRQAVLDIVSHALTATAGGVVRARVSCAGLGARVSIQAQAGQETGVGDRPAFSPDDLEMARRLLRYCQGELHIEALGDTAGRSLRFAAAIDLPSAEQATVLVIDDNADTRHLIQRYLAGTRFLFVGAEDAQQALALAQEVNPRVIVLDVMMPRQDGWTLLGQLREHPRLNGVPIIVSTILSQAELAMALGAAEFIRKPVRRPELLAALDRQMARISPARLPASQPAPRASG